ncbi:lipid-A-disaccharide synthase [Hirschia litorea]|uniref:Lipid-A-disaccharide synthase n=1 Tax=Hirschia litorea TaxID=1199156 RepID=A0ABW2IHM9_9PROT
MIIYFVAAEPSGDKLASEVIEKIKSIAPKTTFLGVGGEHMLKQGVETLFDTRDLAVFGLLEGVKAYKTVKKRVEETAHDILHKKPDAVVLVDSWGFMWRVAKRVKELGYNGPRIKLIGPQVWATRAGRAKTLAAHVDHLLCIHDFEVPFYTPFGLETTVIGNPALDRCDVGDGIGFRRKHNFKDSTPLLLLLPGSRSSEIVTVAPILEQAAELFSVDVVEGKVICVAAGPVQQAIVERSKGWNFPHLIITDENQKADAFAAANVALACSGTVTTEVALQGTPLVVGYKIGWISWVIARLFLMKSKFITLLNVSAGAEIIPEFIQTRFTSKKLAKAVLELFHNPNKQEAQILNQNLALEEMGRGGRPSSEIAARKIVELVPTKKG